VYTLFYNYLKGPWAPRLPGLTNMQFNENKKPPHSRGLKYIPYDQFTIYPLPRQD